MLTAAPALSPPALFPMEGNGPYRLLRGFQAATVQRFEAGLRDPEAAQRARLAALIGGAAGTAFGQEHGIAAGMSLDQWRAAMPIRTHAGLLPWLDRVAAGEPKVLTQAAPSMLLETSGSTGRPKHLPVTPGWAASVRAAQELWMLGLLRDDEGLAGGRALSVVSPAVSARSPGGLPIGANTGRMFLAQPWWSRWRSPVPYRVFCIKDPDLRAYVLLRHALCAEIRSWTTANPSTLLLYCRHLRRFWEDLSRDCRDGTLKHGPAAALGAWDRLRLGWGSGRRALPPEPLPARIWPLRRINCWKGGSAAFFLGRLQSALGALPEADIPVREVGITASEGFFAVPVDEGDPLLWADGHVLEFVAEDGAVCWPWELEAGREYRLILSTEAGLYRYDLQDQVRVTGFTGRLARLRFVGKSGNVLNATGEKVSEEQIALAIREVFPAAAGGAASMAWGEVPRFRVAVEGEAGDDAAQAARLDAALRRLNPEYDSKRETARLGALSLSRLPAGSLAAWRAAAVRAGAPEAQVKDPWVLSPERWDRLVSGAADAR